MVDLDLAPATVTHGAYRAAWSRALIVDGKLYVARNPKDPTVEVFDLPPDANRTTLAGSGWQVAGWRLTTCGCAKGSWLNWSPEQLIARATPAPSPTGN